MKLELLRYIAREVQGDLKDDVPVQPFYFFNNKWHLLDASQTVSASQVRSLERVSRNPTSLNPRKGNVLWYSIPSLNSVLLLDFGQPQATATLNDFSRRVDVARQRAEFSFKVSHHPLTLLLAKDAFHQSLSDSISLLDSSVGAESDPQESIQTQLLAVFALDIDYFKQINDTYGHLYGDQVLKTFGRRLESAAREVMDSSSGRVNVVLGHPSGEEFLAYITGSCSRDEVLAWSEQFRSAIADEILPTQAEWDALAINSDLSMLQLPPQQDRGVRASIGVCFRSAATTIEIGSDEAKFLLERADTALYRAKAGGRNQVVVFDTILEQCGRILEQDAHTRIVAIDIGSNVGVSRGQEFKVYSPLFTGATKFLINDGRTTRTLGVYPRVELTRVTVFDVQAEISFAFVSLSDDKNIDIPKASHLEAIPVGSIGHIVPYTTKYFASGVDTAVSDDISSLRDYLKEEVGKKREAFAAVFRFANEQEYLRKYGSAALNVGLTHLYRDVLSDVRSVAKVAALDTSSVGIVAAQKAYREDLLEQIVDNFYENFPELGLVVGVCESGDIKKPLGKLESPLNPANAIEFAQLAASHYGRETGSKVTHFNYKTARRLLSAQREARALTSGQADFEKLRHLGVMSPLILNEGGLIYSAAGLKKLAAEQYEAASSLDPNMPVFKSNLALALKSLGEIERALKTLDSLGDEELSHVIKNHPTGALNYAVLLARAKNGKGNQYFDQRKFALVVASVLDYKEDFKASRKSDYQLIVDALR